MNDSVAAEVLAEELRLALDDASSDLDRSLLARHVDALSARYRAGGAASTPILGRPELAAAYAAYRMPATFAAAASALRQAALRCPGFAPTTLLDLGGGTGAASWAAASVFPSLDAITVVDHARDALAVGRSLAKRSRRRALREAEWRQDRINQDIPTADLVVVSYVLSELTPREQLVLARDACRAGSLVVVVEPGTPDGHRRVLDARRALLEHAGRVIAPCPHSAACPMEDPDWCHFAVRLPRSSTHRAAKRAQLGHEDEKFAYVAVDMDGVDADVARSRVLRRPAQRKGLVQLTVCRPDGTTGSDVVSKRQGADYRRARSTAWGDQWPPPE